MAKQKKEKTYFTFDSPEDNFCASLEETIGMESDEEIVYEVKVVARYKRGFIKIP